MAKTMICKLLLALSVAVIATAEETKSCSKDGSCASKETKVLLQKHVIGGAVDAARIAEHRVDLTEPPSATVGPYTERIVDAICHPKTRLGKRWGDLGKKLTLEECLAACTASETCTWVTFREKGGSCTAHSESCGYPWYRLHQKKGWQTYKKTEGYAGPVKATYKILGYGYCEDEATGSPPNRYLTHWRRESDASCRQFCTDDPACIAVSNVHYGEPYGSYGKCWMYGPTITEESVPKVLTRDNRPKFDFIAGDGQDVTATNQPSWYKKFNCYRKI